MLPSHAGSRDGTLTRSWQIPGLELQAQDFHPRSRLRPSPVLSSSCLCSCVCQMGPVLAPLQSLVCPLLVARDGEAAETWSRAMGRQGSPKWTTAFCSSKQMAAGSPGHCMARTARHCSPLRGQPSHINSGSRPSLSPCSGPLVLEPEIPGAIRTGSQGGSPGTEVCWVLPG